MANPIGRRGFFGAAIGSIAAAFGWKPKAATIELTPEMRIGRLAALSGPDHWHARPGDLMRIGNRIYTSEDHVRFYNRAAETRCPAYHAGYQLVADDPFATFVIDTISVGV